MVTGLTDSPPAVSPSPPDLPDGLRPLIKPPAVSMAQARMLLSIAPAPSAAMATVTGCDAASATTSSWYRKIPPSGENSRKNWCWTMFCNRFRSAADPLRLVIVRDMWLTGFDAPSLHTMYVDKPMRGHGMMQAIARVNRVFRDKPGGLVVDYLGLAHELKAALATYTESGGTGRTALDQGEAVALMVERYEVCCDLFHGFDRSKWTSGMPQGVPRRAVTPVSRWARTRVRR